MHNYIYSGNGEFPTEYKKYTNLHFFGNMKYEDYLCLLDSATICLNLRNPNLPENNNNFPSKVLDYFSKGKIVLSTISYPEIKIKNYSLSEYNEAAITKSIQDIINMDINELLKYSDNISFLHELYSASLERNNTCCRFIKYIVKYTVYENCILAKLS